MNFVNEGLRRAHINALLAAVPELDDSAPHLPSTAIDADNGYFLLHKSDKEPINPPDDTREAIWEFLDYPNHFPKIKRWARLLLPNGQVARSAWREKHRSSDNV